MFLLHSQQFQMIANFQIVYIFKSNAFSTLFNKTIFFNQTKQAKMKEMNRHLYLHIACVLKTQTIVFSKCLLRHGVLRVFELFCVFVFVRAILSWCP